MAKQLLSIKNKLRSSFYLNCLQSTSRKVELIFCIAFYITLECLMRSISSPQINGIFAQIQSVISIYIAFRFIYLGLSLIFVFNLLGIFIRICIFTSNHSANMLIAITMNIVTIISSVVISFLANAQYKQKDKLNLAAISDELTNVYNERYFHSVLETEIKNSSSVGLIFIDIDDFKMFNGVYGHIAGNNFLIFFAELLKKHVNGKGTIYRYEGDEFAIILPNTCMSDIEGLALRIREDYEISRKNDFKNNANFKVSFSMGLAEYPNMSSDKEDLISKANMALYHAKNLGKDIINSYHSVIQQLTNDIGSDHSQLLGAFKALLSCISVKDKYTFGHSERVSSYAVMIGRAMNLEAKYINDLQYAGLLHDIGKVEIPLSVLNKSKHLTDEEYEAMKKHPVYSADILKPLEGMSQIVDFVRHHHERFDGNGYPDGLKGEEISLGARILCVADSFDAMLSSRSYSGSRNIEDVLDEMELLSGTQFDQKIVDIFIGLMLSKSPENTSQGNPFSW